MVGLESRQMVKIATDPAGEAYILFGHYTCLTTRQRTPFFSYKGAVATTQA